MFNSKDNNLLYEAYASVYNSAENFLAEAGKNDARIRGNIKSFGSNYTPPRDWDQSANRGQGAVLNAKQKEKQRRKGLRQEDLETWVNDLIEEGYDLSSYTWEEMYEMYVTEGDNYDKNRQRAAKRAAERNAARDAGKTGNVPGVGYVTPRRERETYRDSSGVERHTSGAKMPKKDVKEDVYEIILSYLLDEGYADDAHSAVAIMGNMSEEWRDSIVEEVISEGEKPFPDEKVKAKQVALRDKGSASLERRMKMGLARRRAKEAEKTGGSQQDAGKGWYHGR